MKIETVGLPYDTSVSLKEFANTSYAQTAFGKLFLALLHWEWTKVLTAVVRIDVDFVHFSLSNPYIMNDEGGLSVEFEFPLTKPPSATEIAKRVAAAFTEGIAHRSAVRLMLERQEGAADLALNKLIEEWVRDLAQTKTGTVPEKVFVGEHVVSFGANMNGPSTFILRKDVWNESPQMYTVSDRPYIVAMEWSLFRIKDAIQSLA